MAQSIGTTSDFRGIPSADGAVQSTRSASRSALWTGRILSGIPLLFLAFDTSMKLLGVVQATEATAQLGYPASSVLTIGVIELVCVVACLVPRTAVLGAILCTGYLGGAIATHVRVESPLFTHTLFPIYVAILLWAGLWLRNETVRAVFPFSRAR